jgi:hypothetical protein
VNDAAEGMAAELDELERMSFAVLQAQAAECMDPAYIAKVREMHAHTMDAIAEERTVEFTPLQGVGFSTIRRNMQRRKRP